MERLSRRHFLIRAGAVTVGFAGLQSLVTSCSGSGRDYGPLQLDAGATMDLPEGFSYRVISTAGDPMSDGFLVPARADGMATFPGPRGTTVLIRNHEVNAAASSSLGPFGVNNPLLGNLDPALIYDAGSDGEPRLGGTTTLVYDTVTHEVQTQFLSLIGTLRNCAGGPTPWGSWISCEESVVKAGELGCSRDHGYCFEVPVTISPAVANPVPLTAMGRFNHEAVAVDPATSIIYLTEDRHESLFYRFLPVEREQLARGGTLQALVVTDRRSLDTRNWEQTTVQLGDALAVEWIDLDDVDSAADDLRFRGHELGAARFARGEGIWYGDGAFYFACTNGGGKKKGQIFRHRPGPGTLELFAEPNDSELLENADNLTVAPWGDLLVCEDGPGGDRIIGITAQGHTYPFAQGYSDSEFAGVTFSPDGGTLFVSLQFEGKTFAITGPWRAV